MLFENNFDTVSVESDCEFEKLRYIIQSQRLRLGNRELEHEQVQFEAEIQNIGRAK